MTAANIDILLVEDDARLAELTATFLGQNGLRVSVEARGDRALERFAAGAPAAGAARPAAARQGRPGDLPRDAAQAATCPSSSSPRAIPTSIT
jgi:CheY-like chemotaxis protein